MPTLPWSHVRLHGRCHRYIHYSNTSLCCLPETSDIRSQKTALTFPCALFKLPVGNVLHWKCTAVSIFNRFEMICWHRDFLCILVAGNFFTVSLTVFLPMAFFESSLSKSWKNVCSSGLFQFQFLSSCIKSWMKSRTGSLWVEKGSKMSVLVKYFHVACQISFCGCF